MSDRASRLPSSVPSLALVVLWSSGFIGAELTARAGADPLSVLAWRFVLLVSILLTVQAVRHRVRSVPWPSRQAWRQQAVIGVMCQAVYLTLVFEGVAHGVPGGTAALIAAAQPLLVATIAGPLLGEHAGLRTWIGLVVGLAGVALVVGGDLGAGTAPLWAYALPVIAMLSLGTGTVLERRMRPTEDLLQTLMMQAVVTTVVLMTIALATGRATPTVDVGFWRAVLWLTLLSSLGGYLMYVYVARARGATVVSTLLYLTPPTTMLWAFVMFREPVPVLGYVGLVVCAVGVGLALGRRAGGGTSSGKATAPVPVGARHDAPPPHARHR